MQENRSYEQQKPDRQSASPADHTSGRQSDKQKARKERWKKNGAVYGMLITIGIFFCGMALYYIYYLVFVSSSVVNNSYNTRISSESATVSRGSIYDSAGNVLAYSQEQEDGTEVRYYPYGEVFAHPIGYAKLGAAEMESSYNYSLLTSSIPIWEQLYNDIIGEKNPGNSLCTSLNASLQQYCYSLLEGYQGAVVVMEPSTGRILAMVSRPGYDPNTIAENWDWLISDENTSANLLNRATQGVYPPGSTFKLLTELAYIRQYGDTWQNLRYNCTGTFSYNGLTLDCHDKHVHGEVDLRYGLANSCNGIHAQMGLNLNKSDWVSMCESFLFNQKLPIDLASSVSTISLNEESSDWETILTSIGQGTVTETPLLNCMITATIANNGVMMKPQLVDRIVNAEGKLVQETEPEVYATLMSEAEAYTLGQFMGTVVSEGTGAGAASSYGTVAGKTGSAEYTQSGSMHAWFTGYAPMEDPKVAVTVILEGAGTGGDVAAPVAKQIFDYCLSHDIGLTE